MSAALFGIVAAGHPVQTVPLSTVSSTSFLYALPQPFSHLAVFVLPGVALPPATAAAIYLAAADAPPPFRFLGAVGPGKESAVFRVGDAAGPLVLGIELEPADTVAARLRDLAAAPPPASVADITTTTAVIAAHAPAPAPAYAAGSGPDLAMLAHRIIANAFSFLAGFSGTAGPGLVEVVPLRAFEDWWRKFENRIRSDPSFLQRQLD